MLQEGRDHLNKATALGKKLSAEQESIRRRQLISHIVGHCVSAAALEDTTEDKRCTREAITEVLDQTGRNGNSLFSDRDRSSIIEWVDWKLGQVYKVADVLYGDDAESQNSDESYDDEKDSRPWMPDFRKSLSD